MLLKIAGLFLALIVITKPTLAAEEFNISQHLVYTVNQSGDAIVDHEISLTNNFSGIYAKEYVVQLSDVNVDKVTASNEFGSVLQKTENDGFATKIHVKFNQPAIGKSATQIFKLNYRITNFAQTKGKLTEISLPDYQSDNKPAQSILKVPLNFGNLAFASVKPNRYVQDNNYSILTYDQTQNNSKILLAFGDSQLFDFQLTYHLNNTSSDHRSLEIPIPPDTANQRIVLTNIVPPPANITINEDGNWLANYPLNPEEKLLVTVEGQAKIISSLASALPNSDYLKKLTTESSYWPVSDPIIQNILPQVTTPKDIYDYVVRVLNYDYTQINTAVRKGAKKALSQPNNSLCTEFTDLFVTLARAKKIPAREIEGYAFTNNPKIKPLNSNADVLHAWPQYWDDAKSAWVSIDPTWGKTTNGIDYFDDLDLNHFTFVIHGQNSDYPPPPGSYRGGQDTKTVNIKFASRETPPQYHDLIVTTLKTAINEKIKIRISNPNPNSINNLVINSLSLGWEQTIPALPPLSETIVTIPNQSFIKSLNPKNQRIELHLKHLDSSQDSVHQIKNLPHYLNLGISAAILITILSIGGIIITSKVTHA